MYCPNCGNKHSEGQNFCRTCGLGLEKIAQSVNEQLPSVSVRGLQTRQDKLERLGIASASVLGLGIIGFLLYMVFTNLLLSKGLLVAVLAVLGAIIFLGSGLLSVILFAQAKDLKEAAAKRPTYLANELGTSHTTGKIAESHEQPAFSVAERTTNLLSESSNKD